MRERALADDDVRRSRAAAQLLHRPRMAVPDMVARLLAVQAQDIGAAPLALRARARGLTPDRVTAARNDGSVVRAWGPRGTLHLMTPDDLAWLLPLLGPGWTNRAMRRLAEEKVTGTPEDLIRVTERAVAGQGPLTKSALGDRLSSLGVRARGQGIVYLAFLAASRGKVVLGPDRANRPTYVHAAEWLGRDLSTEGHRGKALAELARGYLRAHAPAGPEDLATWSGLPLRDARAAWALIGDELAEVVHADSPLWWPRRGAARVGEVPVVLVPAFDEYLLGWRDRSLTLSADHAKTIAPGGGIIRPAIIGDGRVVGTWRVIRPPSVTPDLFEPVDPTALGAEVDDVTRFMTSRP